MRLLSSLVRLVGTGLRARGRGASRGRVLRALATIVLSAGVVGVGTAHAQECDPVEAAKLLAGDGAAADFFGYSVSISGDTALIGTPADDDNGTNSGSAYVYSRSGGVWTQQARLLPDDGAADDWFGFSVSLSGDTALVGAKHNNDNGINSGAAYVFTRSGGVWTQQAKLLPDDGARDDRFGWTVSLSGDTALIGSRWDDDNGINSGAAYVFTRSGGGGSVWTQQAKLLPDDGAADELFGFTVSLSGDTAVVGSLWDDDNGTNSGSAYVFSRSGGGGSVWTQQAKLLPADGEPHDWFSEAISVSGDTALIGVAWDDDNGTDSGSAYVFIRSGSVWTQQAKILLDGGSEHDEFGRFVSLSNDTALIGAYRDDDNGDTSGSAYIYSRTGGVWTEQAKLIPDDGAAHDRFGWAVSIDDDTALIGAWWDDDNGTDSGSAYVFDLGCIDCPADLNGDGVVNTQDFLAFLGAWSAGDTLADWNGDGDVNTLDFLAYLADWSAGCG